MQHAAGSMQQAALPYILGWLVTLNVWKYCLLPAPCCLLPASNEQLYYYKEETQCERTEDARAAVSDEQMRSTPRYPVDRYLVESSRNMEMVNIIGDDLWEPEPALRPEDEIILRKLHNMLRSTAEDLKELSGELSKYHKQDKEIHVKSQPTPLDEEFNEKIHIEEVVSARFNNYKLIDKNPVKSKNVVDGLKTLAKKVGKPNINAGTQSNVIPPKKTVTKRLGITPVSIVHINETDNITKKAGEVKQKATVEKLNNGKVLNAKSTVVYNEFSYEYVKPKPNNTKQLQIQDMPSINIRSELKEQKVLLLDIMPENIEPTENTVNSQSNVAVIAAEHAATPKVPKTMSTHQNYELRQQNISNQSPVRKVTKISTGESSVSSNNISSASNAVPIPQRRAKSATRMSPKPTPRTKSKKSVPKKENEKRIHFNLDDWKRKLNSVYSRPSTSRNDKTSAREHSNKQSCKPNLPSSHRGTHRKLLNNTEYIPYSKLTLGGAKVSDVEREISDLRHKDIPLSPILDKILSSQENTPRLPDKRDNPKVLNSSDENLLEEVLYLEKAVSQTLSVKLHTESKTLEQPVENISKENSEQADNDSYADDFEDEQSESTQNYANKSHSNSQDDNVSKSSSNKPSVHYEEHKSQTKLDKSIPKSSSLSIKKSVDIFECVHSIDTRDTATQSNKKHKISLKETQTSPRISGPGPNIHPIHNELWPSLDPKGEVEKMFQLEKEYIKKVILDEYGDLITRNLTKPSTSQETINIDGNVTSNQKNTQTSPAHVKCVMTSPTRTKTRTTSPLISVKVEKDHSPMVLVTNEQELTLEIDIGKDEDAISVNLSSPRFNLRLPNTSREVLSNKDTSANKDSVVKKAEFRTYRKQNVSSSSSDGNYSSSELSSLGEVKLRKLLKKNRVPTILSESSSSSSVSKYSLDGFSCGILPLRSEGEVTNSLGQGQSRNCQGQSRNSQGQLRKKKNNSKSEGEMSLRTK